MNIVRTMQAARVLLRGKDCTLTADGAFKVRYNRSRPSWDSAMLNSLSKQISHCHFRAAECRECADRCVRPRAREFYIEREQAWLTLARSYEFQERLNQMVTERGRNEWRGGLSPEQRLWIKPPECP